jgi:hypothetical protein
VPTERFLLTALPVSIDPVEHHHVSLHFAPRLTPDGSDGRLGDFALFRDWPAHLSGARITLLNEAGAPISVTPLLGTVDPSLWADVFPPDTPVRGQRMDALANRRWRTFPAKAVHDSALATQFLAMLSSSTEPPAPSGSFLTRGMLRVIGIDPELLDLPPSQDDFGRPQPNRRLDFLLEDYREDRFTQLFDTLIGRTDRRDGLVAAGADAFTTFLTQLHQTRRYYERPEAAPAHRPERPEAGAVGDAVARPEPDFHEQVAHLADQPELQRLLGVVIDLKVDDLAALASAKEISARIELPDAPGAAAAMITPVTVAGSALLTVPSGPEWRAGRLRMGDPQQFGVLLADSDGSALKLDRFLWSLPRLLRIERNGDPSTAAPPALRVGGFTVVRSGNLGTVRDQLDRAADASVRIDAGGSARLATEDVTRGFRVEVWDDAAERWFSLHKRRLTAEVAGRGVVLNGVPSEGYVQGTGATETPGITDGPVHVHDALFGWSGWSLSVPRPGPRLRHEAGTEHVEDTVPDDAPVTRVSVSSGIEPGTLPRLRFGRSYAFRAWSVDIAGNVPPHSLGPPAQPDDGGAPPAGGGRIRGAEAARAGAVTTIRQALDQVAGPVSAAAASLSAVAIGAMRQDARMAAAPRRAALQDPSPTLAAQLRPITGVDEVDQLVRARIIAARAGGPTAAPLRAELATNALRQVLDLDQEIALPLRTPTSAIAAAIRVETMASADIDPPAALALLQDTMTPLVPYLRFEPVLAPAVVARHRMTEAESVRHLVIRSGVAMTAPADQGGTITVSEPGTYAAAIASDHPGLDLGYRATSERHLAPPKTSQAMAETHGLFDEAIGSADPAVRRRLLAVALRDDGTLLDREIVDIADPTLRHPQDGIRLEAGPEVPPSTRTDLASLKRGDPLAPGEYVVHDTDQLVLPYLPDPLARGLALVFPDAGKDRPLPVPFSIEGMTTPYAGTWPALEPYRLVLAGGETLAGKVEGNVITITLPLGRTLRMRVSSSLKREDLDLLGLWTLLPAEWRQNPVVYEPATSGWLWAFTPSEEVTLVHAVPRPVEVPRPTILTPFRAAGGTSVSFTGAIDCHGPSTDNLDAEAAWTEWLDDVAYDGPTQETRKGAAFTTSVDVNEDLVVLFPADQVLTVPGFGRLRLHGNKHELNDTKHRIIDYAFRATTRYREYFHPALVDDPDERSVVGPTRRISVPSSARPAAPVVHSILPLFRWDEQGEPEQPFGLRRRRRSGLRLYLERPWFSSGENELLAVLLAPSGVEGQVEAHVSQWGADPVWLQRGPERRALFFEISDLLHSSGLDDRPEPGRPVTKPVQLPLVDVDGAPSVQVVGYRPQFQPSRGLWTVDVAIDPGTAIWPFVRLAVARYQPDSLAGQHLSPVVRCDFTQLAPERTAAITRPDAQTVRILVNGPVGLRAGRPSLLVGSGSALEPERIRANRRMIARLEQRDPAIGTDLGWKTTAVTELGPIGSDAARGEVTWFGLLALTEPIPFARPGAQVDWRVTVEEWEGLEADPVPFAPDGRLTMEWRLAYADHLPL